MTNNNKKSKIIDVVRRLLANKEKKQQKQQEMPSRFHWGDDHLEVIQNERDKTNEELFEKETLDSVYRPPNPDYIPVTKISQEAKKHYSAVAKTFKKHHREALDRYTKDDHGPINHLLRKGKLPDYYETSYKEKCHHLIDNLKQVTSHKTPEDHVVYRGFGHGVKLTMLKRGNVLHDKGFTSTSMNPATAGSFAREDKYGNHMAKIHVPKGTKGHYIGGGEQELILHPGTKFKVQGHSHVPDGGGGHIHLVHMKVVR